MSLFAYRLATLAGRFAFVQTIRLKVLRPEMIDRDGPLLIACTHLSHIDPFLLSIVTRKRQIDWMARIEFWKHRVGGRFMESMDAIPVRRFGVAASAIRTAIERLKRGRIVGVCPEGGVAQGTRSVMRGGEMKKGVCLISYRSGVPILPCIMLGTDKLNRVGPWIPPLRQAVDRLWFAADLSADGHAQPSRARELMAAELSREYQAIYKEVKEAFGLTEADVP